MPTSSQHDDGRRIVLCIRTPRADVLPPEALAAYECYVVGDTRTASRKARLGAFDLYVGLDAHASSALVECWRTIRAFDRNTPFLFILRARPPALLEAGFAAGVDSAETYGAGAAAVRELAARLLALAEQRSLEARREEVLAIRDEIRDRLARLEWRVTLSRDLIARAQEHVVRAYGMKTFTGLGGTRAHFERWWSETYEDALTGSVDEAPARAQR